MQFTTSELPVKTPHRGIWLYSLHYTKDLIARIAFDRGSTCYSDNWNALFGIKSYFEPCASEAVVTVSTARF